MTGGFPAPRHQIWEAVGCISVEKSNMKIPADAAAQVVHLAAVSYHPWEI